MITSNEIRKAVEIKKDFIFDSYRHGKYVDNDSNRIISNLYFVNLVIPENRLVQSQLCSNPTAHTSAFY